MRLTKDEQAGVVVIDGDLWVWRADKEARRILKGLTAIRQFHMAPDGSAVSYVKDNNLHVTRTRDGETFALSKDGSDDLFYGELDWVYQEEVYGRGNFQATWWAPDSRHVAYMRIDESGVNTFVVVDHIPNALQVDPLKYPKAGTTNPRATLHVARADDGRSVAVDLSAYDPKDEILIVRVGWTPEGDRVVCKIQNREQTWLDLLFVDPATGAVKTIVRERCEDGWVNVLEMPRWLADGSFIWQSERTGYKHLYRYDRDGKLIATVTHGDWEVRGVVRLEDETVSILNQRGSSPERPADLQPDDGWVVVYGSTPDYAIGQHAYVATLGGKKLNQVTKGRGSHQVSFNGDGSLLLDSFSSFENPGEQWLRKADGTDVRQIMKRDLPEDAEVTVWKQIEARDGEWIDISYRKPKDFDPSKKYPVWIDTYSGPDAATIQDGWRGGSGGSDWYASLNVNVRTASKRGMKYTKACYKQFGVQELKDIEDAIDWMIENHPWVDGERVGISGWSYGGYMAAFALTHSKKFKCGIAGAGVYDWELYDTIYTERYMATPQNNPDGYAKSSVVKAAKDLHGELLIVHGTMDDNVHMQNAIQLVGALQRANKLNFTFMLYPKSRHGVRSPHLGALRQKFMKENL
jgi:dipeptidyl-peptidase-4